MEVNFRENEVSGNADFIAGGGAVSGLAGRRKENPDRDDIPPWSSSEDDSRLASSLSSATCSSILDNA